MGARLNTISCRRATRFAYNGTGCCGGVVMAANVDTSRALDELESVLHRGTEPNRCMEAMDILRRWQWDRDLDDASRNRACTLLREFCQSYG